ncbi:MAG: diguanylate cyclase, partial [Deinococcota bacterium]
MLAASEDALTGALLRNTFEDDVTAWLTRGAQQGFDVSLLVIDLDYLKLINDAFGHLAGDSALATVAAYIRQHLHSDDLLFRYGGDEFVVLLPNTSLEQASQRAQEILITTLTTPLHIAVPTSASAQVAITSQTVAPTQDSLQNPLQEISLSLSIGVASMPAPEPVRTVQALFAQADARAYLSKKLGRGRVTDNDPTAPTDTRDHSQSQLDELTEIRLLGREDVLERVRDILKAPLTPTAKRAMWIYGKAGSGMSRVLAYAASLATMLGQVVIHLEATPARKLRWLGALSEAVLPVPWLTWQNLCQPELVLRTLEQHNATSNVVVILDRVDLLDRDSREYITALLTALPRVILLYSSNHNQPDGYAYDGHSDPYDETLHRGFDVVTRVYLAPLSLTDVARWLQGSTGYAASVAGSVQQQPEMLTAPFTETSSTQVSSTQVSSTQVSST